MPVYTVGQVVAYLKDSLNRDPFLGDLWVKGEVSNLSRSVAGHLYFVLKDGESQLRCVMFRPERGGSGLAAGDAIIAHGRVSFYQARGEVQLYVDLARPEGTGALHLELERLKAKLEDEGLFEPSRKRPLPTFPRRVGVVTSPTGAAFHDICTVIGRRYPLAEVVLSPTLVQGDQAAQGIVEAMRVLNDLGDIDVIIVARGGGSLEEMWAFNQEAVARAVYASRVPVITGIGHETDTTLADLVADRRAPTPSAAAELAVPDVTRLLGQVATWQRAAVAAMGQEVFRRQQALQGLTRILLRQAPQPSSWSQRVDELTQGLARALGSLLAMRRERFQGVRQRLATLDPRAVLGRGYAVVQRASNGSLVTRVGQAPPETRLTVTVQDGRFRAKAV
ncbi:MAG: exodeoxyribonuclease VII large subunit [Chloroflexi bacterium]|nr:exodeoxyribonuclease VII large subunit [Chloroflexota bacterium]